MGASQRFSRGAALTCAVIAAWAWPAHALASDTEQSILMDDDQLIYASPDHVASAIEQIAALGVDRIKVSMVWSLVAPDANSDQVPSFDATDPNAYPSGAWARYDRVVELAQQAGLGVYFQLTGPAPAWAVSHAPEHEYGSHGWSHEPDPGEFEQFAEAVGRRYSGTFTPPGGVVSTPPIVSLPLGLTTISVSNPTNLMTSGQAPAKPGALPAVRWWGIWNEPNEVGWLSPQTRRVDGRTVAYSPVLDRELTDAGDAGLAASGHSAAAGDTILIGETASGGQIEPTPFVRDLYCVGRNDRPLRGAAASVLGCPASGSPAAFVAAHPALFDAAGFAHHPYSFDHEPNTPFAKQPGIITLANLGGFEHTLDRIFIAYGQPPGLPLYLTEWGYKTDPPNPYVHTSLAQQAMWLNEGEYMTWKDPRIKALAQFLLYDDLPRATAIPGTLSYWSTFQSGLYYADGNPKPSLDAYRIPIWIADPRPGPRVAVWGELRPADHTAIQYAVVEFEPAGSATWNTLEEVQTSSPEGYLLAHVPIPGPGAVRLEWLDPTGVAYDSRTVSIG